MIENPIPEELLADHLFLLIGGNPIPNWVASRLLAKPDGKTYLVHSSGQTGTTNYALRLSKVLLASGSPQPELISIFDEADASEIFSRVMGPVSAIRSGQIALNYTGGTKAMAVHAYRAVTSSLQPGLPPPLFSYLDAGTQLMIFDPDPGRTEKRHFSVGLAGAACLNLDTLCGLHEDHIILSRENQINTKIRDATVSALVEINARQRSFDAWKLWRIKNLHDEKNRNKLLRGENLNLVNLEALYDPALSRLGQVFANCTQPNKLTFGTLAKSLQFDSLDKFAVWLDGGWLEDYTFDSLLDTAEDCQMHSLAKNLQIQGVRHRSKTLSPFTFEIDVVGMRGYSMIAISCYSGQEKGISKEHLIEICVRARQMGGDEVRVALVAPTAIDQQIEDEVTSEMDGWGKIRVFGMKELNNLSYSLQQWIREN